MSICRISFVCLAVTAWLPAQLTQVLPRDLGGSAGMLSTTVPWGQRMTNLNGLRAQVVYDSNHFIWSGVNYPMDITGLRWRTLHARVVGSRKAHAPTARLGRWNFEVRARSGRSGVRRRGRRSRLLTPRCGRSHRRPTVVRRESFGTSPAWVLESLKRSA